METAFEAAYNRARRLTKREKRAIKQSPSLTLKVSRLETWKELMERAGAIDDLHAIPKDKGMREPIVVQARPNTRLVRPGKGRKSKAFAKTPRGLKLNAPLTLQHVEEIRKKHFEPEPAPPRPQRMTITPDFSYLTQICVEAEQARLIAIMTDWSDYNA